MIDSIRIVYPPYQKRFTSGLRITRAELVTGWAPRPLDAGPRRGIRWSRGKAHAPPPGRSEVRSQTEPHRHLPEGPIRCQPGCGAPVLKFFAATTAELLDVTNALIRRCRLGMSMKCGRGSVVVDEAHSSGPVVARQPFENRARLRGCRCVPASIVRWRPWMDSRRQFSNPFGTGVCHGRTFPPTPTEPG